MSDGLFCSIQRQDILWPILLEAYISVFSFTLCLRVWRSDVNPWLALAISVGADTWVSVMGFLRHLSGAPRIIIAMLDSHFSRGLHLDNLEVAEAASWLSLAIVSIVFLKFRREPQDAAKGACCQRLALDMDKLEMLSASPLDSLKLNRFKMSGADLFGQSARFDGLLAKSGGPTAVSVDSVRRAQATRGVQSLALHANGTRVYGVADEGLRAGKKFPKGLFPNPDR